MPYTLDCAGQKLDLTHPKIMGVINVTPDSFSDGGQFSTIDKALSHARALVEQGAVIIDIGGESTRPGAKSVSDQQELDRVIPVIEAIRQQIDCIISIDTSKPKVMQEATNAGAGVINDVNALQAKGAMETAVHSKAAVCLMHMQGLPRSMQNSPVYDDVVVQVTDFLLQRAKECERNGLAKEKIILDVGIGFGKSVAHNLSLIKHGSHFANLGYPSLIGVSRKSMFGAMLDLAVDKRVNASVVVATIACWLGVRIIRVHDVKETLEAVKLCAAIQAAD